MNRPARLVGRPFERLWRFVALPTWPAILLFGTFALATADGGQLRPAAQHTTEPEAGEPQESASLGERLRFYRWLETYRDLTEQQRREYLLGRLKNVPLASRERQVSASFGGDYRERLRQLLWSRAPVVLICTEN